MATIRPRKLIYPDPEANNKYIYKLRARDKKIQLGAAKILQTAAITKKSIVLDLGANRGNFTIVASQLAHTVHAYEPNPYAFQLLKLNVTRSNVKFFNAAVTVSHRKNEILYAPRTENLFETFYKSESSTLMNDKINSKKFSKFQISNVFLGTVLKSFYFDFIKIDIEGGEFDLIPSLIDDYSDHFGIVFVENHTAKFPLQFGRRLNEYQKHPKIIWGDLG